jgi:aspartate kinase
MVVMKFGGTSVADAAAIRRVVRLVEGAVVKRSVTPLVVVSAMARVTDRLIALAEIAAQGRRDEAAAAVRELIDRHLDGLHGVAGEPRASVVANEISRHASDLEAVLSAMAILRDASPRMLDAVTATGELVSSRIVAAALVDAGVDAVWIDARRVMVTDAAHPAATPLPHEIRDAVGRHIVPHLAAGRVPVVGGFVGATGTGVTTTLGRGGSDYSAALFGAAVHGAEDGRNRCECREIQVWTDVDGMLRADPRIVPTATVVDRLSFAEASELAYFGAKVLHPSTILPAVSAGIPVRILNSSKPEAAGTLIAAEPEAGARPVTALACKRGVTVVEITSTRMLMAHGFLHRVFGVFEQYKTAVDVVTTSEVSVSVTVDDDRHLNRIAEELRDFADVSLEPGMAILCAVGDNLRTDPRSAVRLLGRLDGLPLRMVSQASSRRNVTVVLHERDLPGAMSRLHDALFVEETEQLSASER